MHRVFRIPFAQVYPLYIQKLERKGRTREELHEVLTWLTGFDDDALQRHIDAGSTLEEFFAEARINPFASSITGMICGMRVEEIEDPLMQKIRCMDKLVDELYYGKTMDKVLRAA